MEMCSEVGANLQRGMNFRLRGTDIIILMSLRPEAPYADRVEDEGRLLIYEGHDCAKTISGPDPKRVDQPTRHAGGSPTQNGLFAEAARRYKEEQAPPERVRVYEKIRSGIWAYNGMFELIDGWTEQSAGRQVFKFKLRLAGTNDHRHPSCSFFPPVANSRFRSSVILMIFGKQSFKTMKPKNDFHVVDQVKFSPRTMILSRILSFAKVLFCLTLICLAIAGRAQGQPSGRQVVNQSIQWLSLNSNIKLNKKYGLSVDGQFRFAEYGNMQHMIRGGFDYYVTKKLSVVPIGFSYIQNYLYGKQPASFVNNERRLWQQIAYKQTVSRAARSRITVPKA